MNPLALGLLALWPLETTGVDTVTIPVAQMVRRQRHEAINDIRVWIQADVELAAARYLRRHRYMPRLR